MTQYNGTNSKRPDTKIIKLKLAFNNQTKVTLAMNLKIVDDDATHKLLLTTRILQNLAMLSQTVHQPISNFQKHIYLKSLGALMSKIAPPLKKVSMPLAKNMLLPLGVTPAADVVIQKLMDLELQR